jgi:hypothetical protein
VGNAKRPARCFVYTGEESLARAVAAGTVTPHDAQVLRDFAALLQANTAIRARAAQTQPDNER